MATQLTVPVFIEKVTTAVGTAYEVQPVFHEDLLVRANREDEALDRATQSIRAAMRESTREPQHHYLARLAFCPNLSRLPLKITLKLRKTVFTGNFFFVSFRQFDRRILFCPKMPELCFEVNRGESLEQRAETFLTNYFKHQERENTGIEPEEAASNQFCRLSYISIEGNYTQKSPKPESSFFFASIESQTEMNGADELETTGRCINRLYPRRIKRAILREEIVNKLYKLLAKESSDKRPIVLVGPSQVGKTAIIHELVAQRIERNKRKSSLPLWLLNPQRLISGMQYVGQWENRFQSILKHVSKNKFILYFDDLLGLFQSGKTRESNLCVADLLKNHLEKNTTRIVAEVTPEQWRLIKEKDRSFADQFQVIPVTEPSELNTQRILIKVVQQLELKHDCHFHPSTIPMVMKLLKRYARTRSFPGKAAEFLEQLSSKHESRIDAHSALNHFQQKSGINHRILNDSDSLDAQDFDSSSFSNIIGQKKAVRAMQDAVLLAKSKLNDPNKPLNSLLFLGPTGVGKTECAKALSEFLFGSEDCMIRIDMNEYVGPDATARLVGHEFRPQGILTTAVKRNPFTVVLLDEIEKAHPTVFDLLLQLLGEGRLTDAAGNTTDFCNTIIILTSNLGAKANASQLGFATDAQTNNQVYVEAAEKFFKPELFNRIDKIIPFHELERKHIADMVRNLTEKAITRFGIQQSKVTLEIDSEVFDFITDKGFDPEYGARTLRRSIEAYLIQPLANNLVQTDETSFGSISVSLKDGAPHLERKLYEEAPRQYIGLTSISAENADELLNCAYDFIGRIDEKLTEYHDTLEKDLKSQENYYWLREQLQSIKDIIDRLERELTIVQDPRMKPAIPSRQGKYSISLYLLPEKSNYVLKQIAKHGNAEAFLEQCVEEAPLQDWLTHYSEHLVFKINYLSFIVDENIYVDSLSIFSNENSNFTVPQLRSIFLHHSNASCQHHDSNEEQATWKDNLPADIHHSISAVRIETPRAKSIGELICGSTLFFGAGKNFMALLTEEREHHNSTKIHYIKTKKLTLDLRSGLISDNNSIPFVNMIAPLLPISEELSKISKIIYTHG